MTRALLAALALALSMQLASPLAVQAEKAPPARKAQGKAKQEPKEPPHVRVIDETGYTLEGGALRLGVFKFQYGVFDFLTVGTYTLPWAVLAATVHVKVRLLEAGPFALAVQGGFAYFDSTRLRWLDQKIGNAVVTAVPLEATGSYRFGDPFSVSLGVAYTEVAVDGALSYQAFDGAGRGAADNFQLTGNAEIQLSDVFALIFEARWLVLQRVAAKADATLYPDAFTTVAVHGDAAASDFQVRDAFSIVPSLLMTIGVFNVRLGVGYGNFNVPLVNFVLPQRSLIPEADVYLLF